MESVYCAVRSESSNTVLSCRPVSSEAEVRFQASLCEICGGRNGTGTDFYPSTSAFLCLYNSTNLYHLNVPLTRRTNVRSRAVFKKTVLFRKSGSIGQTSTSTPVAALGAVDCLCDVCCRRFLPSGPWARTV